MTEKILFSRMDLELSKTAQKKYPNGAADKDNFKPCSDGVYRGYAEIGLHGDKSSEEAQCFNQIHIERLDPACKKKNEVSGVTVVFCAACGNPNVRKVVGWYRNATVYRYVQKHGDGKWFYFEAEKCCQAPINMPLIPRARKGSTGMGQNAIWFPPADSLLVQEVLSAIESAEGQEIS